jgi:N utilization substance protein B
MTAGGKQAAGAPGRTKGRGGRSAARLAAVQALYQIELTGALAENVVREFTFYRLGAEEEWAPLGPADAPLFADIVRGVAAREEEIDQHIKGALAEGWTMGRLDTTLRAILRAGTYELLARPDIPYEVVVNEYVGIAAAFFTEKEPGFVNGILDHLARKLRAGAVRTAADDGSAGSG